MLFPAVSKPSGWCPFSSSPVRWFRYASKTQNPMDSDGTQPTLTGLIFILWLVHLVFYPFATYPLCKMSSIAVIWPLAKARLRLFQPPSLLIIGT